MSEAERPSLLALRVPPSSTVRLALGIGTVAVVLVFWWALTRGASPETRFISPVILPNPAEVIGSFGTLIRERDLFQSIAATMQRVLLGFGLAALVGVPLGILAGSYRVVEASAAPLSLSPAPVP